MNKFIFFALIILLTGCGKDNADIAGDVKNYYINLEEYSKNYDISTNLSDKTQDFTVNFTYNKELPDYITIIKPLSISGVTVEILNNYTPTISFENIFLETFIEENLGVSPSDMLSFAIFDIKEKEPSTINISDTIKLTYISEEISKNIFLNPANYDIIMLEVFISNHMITKATLNSEENFE